MEMSVPINKMLKEDITKLNYTLIPPGFHGDMRSVRVMQDSLAKLIDNLGAQSAAAQGLNRVITTAEKLRNAPSHTMYLLKDSTANGGEGELTGLLKVGRKHLFLFDEDEQVCEVEPLCVLDFFVLSDRQRHGYGRRLFDYMMQDMEVSAVELAIDGPSPKMEQFLTKNYGIQKLIRQNNNFAVTPQFFSKTGAISKSGRNSPVLSPTVGRYAAPKPPSAIAAVIHGDNSYYLEASNGNVSGRASPASQRSLSSNPARSPSPRPLSPHLQRSPSQRFGQPERSPSQRFGQPERSQSLRFGQPERSQSLRFGQPERSPSQRFGQPERSPSQRFGQPERSPSPRFGQPERSPSPRFGQPERSPSPRFGQTERSPSPRFGQATPERPSSLQVAPAVTSPAPKLSPAGSSFPRRDSQLTERGFFDVKFYHNKLW